MNLGILLALAGQDYSCVVEPQNQAQQIKQGTRVTKYIDEIIAFWQNKLTQTPPSKEELFAAKNFYTNSRQFYYDTDNIREQQQEYVHYCPDCPGIYQVISQSNAVLGEIIRLKEPVFLFMLVLFVRKKDMKCGPGIKKIKCMTFITSKIKKMMNILWK